MWAQGKVARDLSLQRPVSRFVRIDDSGSVRQPRWRREERPFPWGSPHYLAAGSTLSASASV